MLDIILPRDKTVETLESMGAGGFARDARRAQENLQHISSLFDYRQPLVKTVVWEIKFRGNKKLAELAAQLLYEPLLAELGERALFDGKINAVLIPVPLAHKRLRERGFNQAARIAEYMYAMDNGNSFSLVSAVARVKETESQTKTRNRAQRLKNLRGAFVVTDTKAVAGKDIIVLDDVATTGATMGEMRKVLLEAGARSVMGLTLAH